VAIATEGAAPKSPAKLLGLSNVAKDGEKRDEHAANNESGNGVNHGQDSLKGV
jgi:hypothetical protein